MSNARTAILGLSLPTRAILWLLEGGIALSISAYLTYRYYPPCAQALSNSLNIQAGGFLVTLVVVAIVFPFALALMSALVLFAAGFVPRQARMAFDVLAMTIVASALVIPTVQEAVQTRSLPQPSVTSILPVASGPLDTAPPPLKLLRIPLGAEVRNDGPEPLDVGVLFIGVNDNRRSYCAGNPPVDAQERPLSHSRRRNRHIYVGQLPVRTSRIDGVGCDRPAPVSNLGCVDAGFGQIALKKMPAASGPPAFYVFKKAATLSHVPGCGLRRHHATAGRHWRRGCQHSIAIRRHRQNGAVCRHRPCACEDRQNAYGRRSAPRCAV